MNPSYIAYQKALAKVVSDALFGFAPPQGDKPSDTDGPAFAKNIPEYPRSDMVVEAEEAKVKAYLDKLAQEVKDRRNQ